MLMATIPKYEGTKSNDQKDDQEEIHEIKGSEELKSILGV